MDLTDVVLVHVSANWIDNTVQQSNSQIQCNVLQNALGCNTVQCSAIHHNTIKYSASQDAN